MERARITRGVLTVFDEHGSPHAYKLSASETYAAAMAATASVQSSQSRKTRHVLGRKESTEVWDQYQLGASVSDLAREYNCTETAVQSAIRRGENGRYG